MQALDLPQNLWTLFLQLVFGNADATIATNADRQRLMTHAAEEGLLPLIFADPRAPAAIVRARESAKALAVLQRRRYELHHEAARRLVEVCGAESFLFIKGFDHRFRLYPSPELRPSADIDIYVPPSNVRFVQKQLTVAGYPHVISSHGAVWSPSSYERGHDVGEVRIEIHRAFGTKVRTSVDYDAVWSEREYFHAEGLRVQRLSDLHALASHVLTLGKDEMASAIIRFVDLWLMLRKWPHLIERFPSIARQWSVERALYGALRVVYAMFPDTRTPELSRVADSLLTARARRFLDERVLPDRTHEPSGHRSRRIQLWRKFWLIDGVARRIAFAANHVWIASSAAVMEAAHPRAVEKYRAAKRRNGSEGKQSGSLP